MADVAPIASAPNTGALNPNAPPAPAQVPNGQLPPRTMNTPPNVQPGVDANPATEPNPVEFWEPEEELWERKLRAKVNDEEIPVSLRELRDSFQLRKLSEQKVSEVARERQRMQAREAEIRARDAELESIYRDPAKLLEYRIEADPESALEWVQALYDRAVEYSKLTPAERKVQWYEKIEKQRAAQEQAAQQRAFAEKTSKFWGAALDESGMEPDDPLARTVYLEAKQIVDSTLAKGGTVKRAQVVDFIRNRHAELARASRERTIRSLKAEDLPPEIATEIARAQVKDARPVIQARVPAGRPEGGQFTNGQPVKRPMYDPFA